MHSRSRNCGTTRPARGSETRRCRVEGYLDPIFDPPSRRILRADSGRCSTGAPVWYSQFY